MAAIPTKLIIDVGTPPLWKPLDEPKQLQEDSGEYFRDQNGARYPQHPMEPAVRALLAQNREFPTQDIDVFACGSTFGNLLRFVRDEDRPFRFVAEKIGNTVFFVRRENSPDEKLQDVRGYGHSFPESYTEWEEEVKGSASHQRLITYSFAGFRFLIRSESDGYLEDKAGCTSGSMDDVHLPADLDSLRMQKGGKTISQEAVFDLKTRAAWRKDQDFLAEQLGRLWVNQTSNFVLAFHDRGLFEDIRVQDVRPDIERWECEHAHALGKLGVLVKRLIALVSHSSGGRCEIRCRERGMLEFRDVGGIVARALPDKLRTLWAAEEDLSSEASEDDVKPGGAQLDSYDAGSSDDDHGGPSWSDDESEKDYTACSAEDCGYCGHCRY